LSRSVHCGAGYVGIWDKHVGAESGLSTLKMEAARYIRNVGTFYTVPSRNTTAFLLFNDIVRRTGIVLESEEKIGSRADEGCYPADVHLRSSYLPEVTEQNWEKH
jgi:hypothetical protein